MALQQNLKRVLLNHPPSSINLHPALCNTLNIIRTKILHVIEQFHKIWAENFEVVNFD